MPRVVSHRRLPDCSRVHRISTMLCATHIRPQGMFFYYGATGGPYLEPCIMCPHLTFIIRAEQIILG